MKLIKKETVYTLEQLIKLNNIKESFGEDESKMYSEISKMLFPNGIDIDKKIVDSKINEFSSILQETPDFVLRFHHDGIEYGFIPDLDSITAGEFIDLDEYAKQGITQAHRVMAILYRPITKRLGEMYDIEKYQGASKYEKVMLQTNYNIYLSSLVFFCNLSKSLLSRFPTSITEKAAMLIAMTHMQG